MPVSSSSRLLAKSLEEFAGGFRLEAHFPARRPRQSASQAGVIR
jgi:hypothetical protein